MGAVLGLALGTGVLLIWHGLTSTPRVRRPGPLQLRLRRTLDEAGLPGVRPGQLVGVQAGVMLVAAAVTFVATTTVTITIVFASFSAAVPWLLVQRMQRRRRADLRELWPEVVDNLTSGVRAGLSLPEALAALGTRGPASLREAFAAFASDYRISGAFGHSLDRLKAMLADPVGDRICESLRLAREVGGTDLGRLLSQLAAFLREDARTRSELMARQSWSVSAARMAVAAPWLVLLLLATRPETLTAYDTGAGAVILLIGAALSVVAYRLMMRIGRLPEDRRVLR